MKKRFRFRRVLMTLLALVLLAGVVIIRNYYLVPFVICCVVLAFCKDEDLYGKKRKHK